MLTPLTDSPRLHLHVTDVLRQQAVEAVQLAREVRRDRDLIDAVEGMVGRIRDTARALGLVHVERAALRALRGLRTGCDPYPGLAGQITGQALAS